MEKVWECLSSADRDGAKKDGPGARPDAEGVTAWGGGHADRKGGAARPEPAASAPAAVRRHECRFTPPRLHLASQVSAFRRKSLDLGEKDVFLAVEKQST